MKKKHLLFLAAVLTACAMTLTFTACGGSDDDDNGGSGGGGGGTSSGQWYIPQNSISSKLNDLSEGINEYGNTMTQSDFFDEYGNFYFPTMPIDWSSGILPGTPAEWNTDGLAAIHIISDNTLEACFNPRTYKLGCSGAAGKTLLFKMDMGFVGQLGRYAEYTCIYTYHSIGSGFWFGDEYEGVFEFNRANGQLYLSGGGYWVQYDPNEVHYGTVKRSY